MSWGDVDLAYRTLKDYYPTYIKKKNEQNIFVEGIYVDNELGRKFKEKGNIEKRKLRLLPSDQFPMTNEINIYDDKIFIISHKDLTGVIIQNKEIVETQRSIFKLGWAACQQYNK